MPVRGTDLVAKNIIAFGGGFTRHVNATMDKVRIVVDKKVAENIGLRDHSLAELKKLDHPYAARWGTSKAKSLHSPYWLVHKQTGELAASQYSGVNPAEINSGVLKASAFVGLDESRAPQALFVVYGTSRMIPRPVLTGSRDMVIPDISSIISSNLKDLVVNFKGEQTNDS